MAADGTLRRRLLRPRRAGRAVPARQLFGRRRLRPRLYRPVGRRSLTAQPDHLDDGRFLVFALAERCLLQPADRRARRYLAGPRPAGHAVRCPLRTRARRGLRGLSPGWAGDGARGAGSVLHDRPRHQCGRERSADRAGNGAQRRHHHRRRRDLCAVRRASARGADRSASARGADRSASAAGDGHPARTAGA